MSETKEFEKLIKQLQAKIKSQAKHIELLNGCDDTSTETIGKMSIEIEQLQTKFQDLALQLRSEKYIVQQRDKRIVELNQAKRKLENELAILNQKGR